MFDRFSDRARRVVTVAEAEARRLGHGHVGTEHLLLGLLAAADGADSGGAGAAGALLLAAGATLDGARSKVAEAVPPASGRPPTGELPLTARAKRALDRATRFSLQRRDPEVPAEDVLRGVLDVEGTAGQVLRGLGVDVPALSGRLERLTTEPPPEPGPASPASPAASAPPVASAEPPAPPSSPITGPRCPTCGADLAEGLAYRTVTAGGRDGARPFVVAFCGACGATLGASPGRL